MFNVAMNPPVKRPYQRILLKLSGEMLSESQHFGINAAACQSLAHSLKKLREANFEVGIVIGGGNIFRGMNLLSLGIARSAADQMGMLATLMNGITLQQALENVGCSSQILTALECPKVAESYTWHKAHSYLATGHIVIFVGGTGNPYFTTDTAAALRASEINADVLIKATKVDGIYDRDPIKHPEAIKFNSLTYSQVLTQKLEIMDATAVALCRSNKIPIFVFNMQLLKTDDMSQMLLSENLGTWVKGE